MEVPEDLYYSKEHAWVRLVAGNAVIGVTDHAQKELGAIVFADLPEDGADIEKNEILGSLESSKTVAEVPAPISGQVLKSNRDLEEDPSLINDDPYGNGWLVAMDIDDTDDPTHGAQQMSLFNAHYDEHCYLPLHIYEGRSGKLITTILRPGKRPKVKEIVSILRRLVAHLRGRWPKVKIFLRGDGHFSTPEVHDWCEENEVFYVLGQGGNKVLKEKGAALLEHACSLFKQRGSKVKLFTSFPYKAKSWGKERRIVCKVEVSDQGKNVRFVVTNLTTSQPSFLYKTIYCARGSMENFIKNHKTFLHSDRTSCHSFMANQFRLFLHSAAYVLLHALMEKGLRGTGMANAQFNTLQNRILKVGARVHEMVTRIRFHFPTSFPLKELFATIVTNLAHASP